MKTDCAYQGPEFPGLLGLINAYLDTLDIEAQEMEKIQQYLGLIRRRADGESEQYTRVLSYIANSICFVGSLLTAATWIRNFVQSHPDYKQDSVVSQEINHDLLVAIDEM